MATPAKPVLWTATAGVRLSDDPEREGWAGVRGQSPLWRSPRPAEIGFAGCSSEVVGRQAGYQTPPEGSAFRRIQA
jgi:hypothetical protein